MSDVYEARFGPHTPESWLSRHAPYILLLAYLYHCTQITIELFDDFFYFYRVMPLVENAILWLLAAAGGGAVIRAVVYAARRFHLGHFCNTDFPGDLRVHRTGIASGNAHFRDPCRVRRLRLAGDPDRGNSAVPELAQKARTVFIGRLQCFLLDRTGVLAGYRRAATAEELSLLWLVH